MQPSKTERITMLAAYFLDLFLSFFLQMALLSANRWSCSSKPSQNYLRSAECHPSCPNCPQFLWAGHCADYKKKHRSCKRHENERYNSEDCRTGTQDDTSTATAMATRTTGTYRDTEDNNARHDTGDTASMQQQRGREQ